VSEFDKNRQLFYSQLEKMFAGRELENFKGKSGFSNLLSIKAKYFQDIKKFLDDEIAKKFPTQTLQSELFQKLYTFFDSYLNETGSPYFNKTEFYKNIYEKVYTNSQDVTLFWKTQRLYYVKSDSIPKDATFEIKNDNEDIKAKIIFDTSELKYTSTNEKKELKFIIKALSKSEKTITLLVVYKSQKMDLGDNYSFEIDSQIKEKEIVIKATKENEKKLKELLNSYDIEINTSDIAKALHTYKKQQDVDFFIHKDAESFLKEQFDIYLYHYLFKESKENLWNKNRIETIQNIKEIAFFVIEKIGAFEDELKAIWLKPKFVRELNYIISLDKIDKKFHNKILANEKLQNEWRELGLLDDEKYQEFLPVDTIHLDDDLKEKILSSFDNLDEITDGVLIKSDNFQALNTIMPKYKGEIDLIYIDPPFNTGSDFAYKDRFQDSTWLTLMENRLRLGRDLLSERGSFYLHLDHNANYMGRFLLNNIFGKENFLNELIWYYENKFKFEFTKNFNDDKETIFIYSKKFGKHLFQHIKIGVKNKRKQNKVTWDKKLKKMVTVKDENGNVVYYESSKKIVGALWNIPRLNSQATERIGFDTQKPESLLKRIIKASSNPDSIVMDFFSGSGTTINTAHKLGRKWIGVEMGEHFESVNLPRIKKTLAGVISGISKELEKEGKLKKGGIVKYYKLESYEDTLFKADYKLNDDGIIDLYNSKKLITENALNKQDGIKLNYKDIYSDIDIWESISNVSGWKIKQRFKNRCIFDDKGKEIEIKEDDLYFSDYPFLRDLIWWKA